MDGALKMSEDCIGGERYPSKTVTFGVSFLEDNFASSSQETIVHMRISTKTVTSQ